MDKVSVRAIDKADYDEVIAVIASALGSTPIEITPPELAADIAASYTHTSLDERVDGADYFVAEISGKIVGIVGFKHAELRTFFVHADHQGAGVGRALYNALEQKALELGTTTLTVCSSQYAKPIYLHFGFIVTGERHKERLGIPYFDYLMEKKLV